MVTTCLSCLEAVPGEMILGACMSSIANITDEIARGMTSAERLSAFLCPVTR